MPLTPAELIIKYLNKSLDNEGVIAFYTWINSSPENKKLFFETKTVYDACSIKNDTIDINESWKKLLDKKQPVETVNLWSNLIRYVAVACMAIVLTSVYFLFFQDTPQEQAVAEYISGNGLEADAVILPDGTRVTIGSKTKFKYSSGYNEKDRIVYLEGEALFEVAKQKDKPFIVKVNGQDIVALGTVFNVMAYPADSILTTTLIEGSISLTTENIPDKSILKPNQQFTYNRNDRQTKVTEVDVSLYTTWVDGYYYFPNQPLEAILSRLGNVYGVTFEIQRELLKNRKFTATFYRGQSIKDIMEIIQVSVPIQYKINKNHIIIS